MTRAKDTEPGGLCDRRLANAAADYQRNNPDADADTIGSGFVQLARAHGWRPSQGLAPPQPSMRGSGQGMQTFKAEKAALKQRLAGEQHEEAT